MSDEVARSDRTGWVAYFAVDRRDAPAHRVFAVIRVPLPDDVSSLAAAAVAAWRIVTVEYGGEARVQGLFEWEGGYLHPRWTVNHGLWGDRDDAEGPE